MNFSRNTCLGAFRMPAGAMGKASPGKGKYGKNKSVGPSNLAVCGTTWLVYDGFPEIGPIGGSTNQPFQWDFPF